MKEFMLAVALALGFAALAASAQPHPMLAVVKKSIVLTEEPCDSLGDGWTNYSLISGRFPLAAGTGRDENDEIKAFILTPEHSRQGGTYRHTLTEPEMPSHKHSYRDKHLRDRRGPEIGDDDDRERHYRHDGRETGSTGKSQPHNNMPPYLVLNFCRWSGD